MNKPPQLVRNFHERFAIRQPNHPETRHLSDRDIVTYQVLLMDQGSATIKKIAYRGDDVAATASAWR